MRREPGLVRSQHQYFRKVALQSVFYVVPPRPFPLSGSTVGVEDDYPAAAALLPFSMGASIRLPHSVQEPS